MQTVSDFFTGEKCLLTLIDVKPKLNQQSDKRIRFDFSMPLTAAILKSAPPDVRDAFDAVAKDGAHLNPVGISAEFEGVVVSIFDTPLTKAARLELENCTLKQLEVARPENKATLGDGDVRLSFHMNVPASKDSWLWGFANYGGDLCAVFEEMEPIFPALKESTNGDGGDRDQPSLALVKSQTGFEPVDRDEVPRQGKEQAEAVAKIKTTKKKKKAKR